MSDTTSSSIFEICKNINNLPHCMYGPFSRFGMEITMDGTLRISIAPILDEMKGRQGGKIAAGTKMYNDEKKAVFTLTHDEIQHIIKFWKEIRTNKYVNNNPKCKPEYKNEFTLFHFNDKDKTSSIFKLTAKDNDVNKLVVYIKGIDGNSSSFQLSNDPNYTNYSLDNFYNVVSQVAKNGIYDKLNFQAIIKRFNSALYKINNNQNTNNNNYKNNNTNNYNNKKETQKKQSEPEPPSIEEEEITDFDDVDFSNMFSNDSNNEF